MGSSIDAGLEQKVAEILSRRFHFAGENPLCDWLRAEARFRLFAQSKKTGTSALETSSSKRLASEGRREKQQAPLCVQSLDSIIAKVKLPSMPQVFHELQALMERNDVTVQELAQVISLDPKMTSSILRLVNSALFNFQSSIDTVSRAIAVLGMRQVSTLALGTLMLGLFKERPDTCPNIGQFWEHSIAVGMATQSLAKLAGRDGLERYFVAGLVHDIGWLALTCSQYDLLQRVLQRADEENCSLLEAEGTSLGMTHADLGARMLETWSLPPNLVAAVRYHHNPSASTEFDEPVFVHVADTLVRGMGYSSTDDCRVASVDISAWEAMELKTAELGEVIEKLDRELATLCKLLLIS